MHEKLLKEAHKNNLEIYEKPMKPTIKGLYSDNVIWINQSIRTNAEKTCILAEELGHYHTSYGDILNQSDLMNRKQETRARTWSYKKLFPLNKIIDAHKQSIKNRHELAEYLGITEEFLDEAINRYRQIYGLYKTIDNYIICLDPLGVIDCFE